MTEKPLIHCGTDILKIVVVLVFWTPHILLMGCIFTPSTNFQYLVMIFSSSRALNPRVRCAFCNVFSQSCWSWFNCFSFQDDIALLVCIILIMALTVFVVIIKVVIIITIICTRPKPARKSLRAGSWGPRYRSSSSGCSQPFGVFSTSHFTPPAFSLN